MSHSHSHAHYAHSTASSSHPLVLTLQVHVHTNLITNPKDLYALCMNFSQMAPTSESLQIGVTVECCSSPCLTDTGTEDSINGEPDGTPPGN